MTIFVEGLNDEQFLKDYLSYLQINDFKIMQVGGNTKLKYNKDIKKYKDNIEEVENVKIIFDADNDLEEARKNIKEQLGNELFNKCEIFLIPNNKDEGNLETLIEKIAKEKCILKCFDRYVKCLTKLQKKNQDIRLPAKKSKVYAYNHCFGYKNGDKNYKIDDRYFDLESNYLQPLKDFLSK
ncbi:hypothetical protein H2256_03670 [Campylobacter sp. RM9929]|uniref:DUF3226 domain-containing protein n=1 Tax=Campylobacter molothri TaxID=1032242 RepID=UPI001DB37D9F|nr:hypothetical protein [Campylobacter sp. RM9929]